MIDTHTYIDRQTIRQTNTQADKDIYTDIQKWR